MCEEKPMDLFIEIKNADGELLRHVTIWESGDEMEYANEIADTILDDFDGARNVNKDGTYETL